MALPTTKQEAQGDYVPFEAGTYQARLKSIDLDINKEYKSEAFNNGQGLRFQGATLTWDISGDEYREMFVKVSMNEKAKFYNRISALVGRDITTSDTLDWVFGPNVRQDATLDDYYKAAENDPEKDIKKGDFILKGESHDGVVGHVADLKVNGESVYGRECMLVLKINEKGYNRAEAGAASPLPKTRKARPEGAPS